MYSEVLEDDFLETLFTKGLVRRPFESIATAAEKAAGDALTTDGPTAAVLRAAEVGSRSAADIVRVRLAAGRWDPPAACARGCAHCCAQRVDITPAEAALIATALPEGDPRRERVKARAGQLSPMSQEERLRARAPCALLHEDGTCSVYAARPLVCRAASSLDASACARAMETTEGGGEIPIEPWSSASMRAAHVGLRRALVSARLPSTLEDIHEALSRVL